MENAVTVAAILGPVLLLLGLSELLYAKQWQKVLDKWEKDHLALVPLMFLLAVLGLIVIRLYNVWAWNVWLLVTISGWAMLVKSVIYFLLPGSTITTLMKMGKNLVYLGGLICVVVGAVLTYKIYFAAVETVL